jgi:anti-anti-sigma factor
VDQDIASDARRPRTARFGIEVHHLRPAVVVLRLAGELDAAAAGELARVLDAAAASGEGPVRIAVDMERVRLLVPEVVDVLVRTEQRVGARGGAVQMYAMSPAVLLMLHDG